MISLVSLLHDVHGGMEMEQAMTKLMISVSNVNMHNYCSVACNYNLLQVYSYNHYCSVHVNIIIHFKCHPAHNLYDYQSRYLPTRAVTHLHYTGHDTFDDSIKIDF